MASSVSAVTVRVAVVHLLDRDPQIGESLLHLRAVVGQDDVAVVVDRGDRVPENPVNLVACLVRSMKPGVGAALADAGEKTALQSVSRLELRLPGIPANASSMVWPALPIFSIASPTFWKPGMNFATPPVAIASKIGPSAPDSWR